MNGVRRFLYHFRERDMTDGTHDPKQHSVGAERTMTASSTQLRSFWRKETGDRGQRKLRSLSPRLKRESEKNRKEKNRAQDGGAIESAGGKVHPAKRASTSHHQTTKRTPTPNSYSLRNSATSVPTTARSSGGRRMSARYSLMYFPYGVTRRILLYLPLSDVRNLGNTCQRLHHIVKRALLDQDVVANHFDKRIRQWTEQDLKWAVSMATQRLDDYQSAVMVAKLLRAAPAKVLQGDENRGQGHGKKPRTVKAVQRWNATLLDWVSRRAHVLQAMTSIYPKLNQTTDFSRTHPGLMLLLLQQAIKNNTVESVKLLVGDDRLDNDPNFGLAVEKAAKYGRTEALSLLLEHHPMAKSHSPVGLKVAAEFGQGPVAEMLAPHVSNQEDLQEAFGIAYHNDHESVAALLDHQIRQQQVQQAQKKREDVKKAKEKAMSAAASSKPRPTTASKQKVADQSQHGEGSVLSLTCVALLAAPLLVFVGKLVWEQADLGWAPGINSLRDGSAAGAGKADSSIETPVAIPVAPLPLLQVVERTDRSLPPSPTHPEDTSRRPLNTAPPYYLRPTTSPGVQNQYHPYQLTFPYQSALPQESVPADVQISQRSQHGTEQKPKTEHTKAHSWVGGMNWMVIAQILGVVWAVVFFDYPNMRRRGRTQPQVRERPRSKATSGTVVG